MMGTPRHEEMVDYAELETIKIELEFRTDHELAEYIGSGVSTISGWRSKGKCPKYYVMVARKKMREAHRRERQERDATAPKYDTRRHEVPSETKHPLVAASLAEFDRVEQDELPGPGREPQLALPRPQPRRRPPAPAAEAMESFTVIVDLVGQASLAAVKGLVSALPGAHCRVVVGVVE